MNLDKYHGWPPGTAKKRKEKHKKEYLKQLKKKQDFQKRPTYKALQTRTKTRRDALSITSSGTPQGRALIHTDFGIDFSPKRIKGSRNRFK